MTLLPLAIVHPRTLSHKGDMFLEACLSNLTSFFFSSTFSYIFLFYCIVDVHMISYVQKKDAGENFLIKYFVEERTDLFDARTSNYLKAKADL